MKINCAIVDDEPLALDLLEHFVAKVPYLHLVGRCDNALEAAELIRHKPIDLLLLDIQMPDVSGISFIKTMSSPPQVIFTTAYREFAVESYELNAVDYLVKPFAFERFLQAVDKLSVSTDSSSGDHNLLIKAENKTFKVPLQDITYLESINETVVIHGSERPITSYQPLSYFEKQLPSDQAVRIHRSFLVMRDRVNAFDHSTIYIDGTELPIGRTYKEGVVAALQS
ncbi:MAG: LytTR family DNA-binding domain-containing protein [Cyclobacteriaceae bacterium]